MVAMEIEIGIKIGIEFGREVNERFRSWLGLGLVSAKLAMVKKRIKASGVAGGGGGGGGGGVSELPHDLVIEVLTRLPAKSLMRFKCVSKLWIEVLTLRRPTVFVPGLALLSSPAITSASSTLPSWPKSLMASFVCTYESRILCCGRKFYTKENKVQFFHSTSLTHKLRHPRKAKEDNMFPTEIVR
ncbi:unnamed protein product [Ilex paraguariensis]|uniref:F-box domain-containing protein n=1 Tax=Ilex paraguariensis TaxID=185542 RepID=A0ABC8QTY9_9AQUA